MTVTYRDRTKSLLAQLRKLAVELRTISADETLPEPARLEAAMVSAGASRAAGALADGITTGAMAAETAEAVPVKRPSARAHPWKSRAVVPARPKGVQ